MEIENKFWNDNLMIIKDNLKTFGQQYKNINN